MTQEHVDASGIFGRVRLAVLSGVGARLVSVAVSLLTLPIGLHTLGSSRYGAFLVITGAVSIFPFLDLGIGFGVVTLLAQARGRGDERAAKEIASSAWLMLLSIGSLLLLAFGVLSAFVDWRSPLGLAGLSRPSAFAAVGVLVVCVALSIPGNLALRLLTGLNRTHQANIWQLVAGPVTLVLTLLAAWMHAGVAFFVAAALGGTLLSNVSLTTWLFWRDRFGLRPRCALADRQKMRELLRLGGLYAFLGVSSAVAFETDSIILAHLRGPASVTTYAVAGKMFAIPIMVASVATTPLWPAFANAYGAGNIGWAKATLKKSMLTATGVAFGAVAVLVPTASMIARAWTSGSVHLHLSLLIAFGVWTVLQCSMFPVSMLLNAAAVIRFQVFSACCMAASNLMLSIALTLRFGVFGPVLGSSIAYVVCTVVPNLVFLRRHFSGLKVGQSTSPETKLSMPSRDAAAVPQS